MILVKIPGWKEDLQARSACEADIYKNMVHTGTKLFVFELNLARRTDCM